MDKGFNYLEVNDMSEFDQWEWPMELPAAEEIAESLKNWNPSLKERHPVPAGHPKPNRPWVNPRGTGEKVLARQR